MLYVHDIITNETSLQVINVSDGRSSYVGTKRKK